MALKSSLTGSVVVLALTAMVAPIQAGSLGTSDFKLPVTGSDPQEIANRVCWTENGARRCRSVDNLRVYGYQSPHVYGDRGPRVYGYRAPAFGYQAPAVNSAVPPMSYGYYGAMPPIGYRYLRPQIDTDPDVHPAGSPQWWDGMDRWDRGGQGN